MAGDYIGPAHPDVRQQTEKEIADWVQKMNTEAERKSLTREILAAARKNVEDYRETLHDHVSDRLWNAVVALENFERKNP